MAAGELKVKLSKIKEGEHWTWLAELVNPVLSSPIRRATGTCPDEALRHLELSTDIIVEMER